MMKLELKDVIRQKRKALKLTQEQFASLLNVATMTVSRWERGLQVPRKEELNRMELFSLSTDVNSDFLGNTPAPQPAASTANAEAPTPNARIVKVLEIPLLDIAAAASCGAGNGLCGVDFRPTDTIFIEASDITRYDDLRKPFAIHTDGDSMEGAGLEEGSVAVVNPAEEVMSGDMALVVYNDNWFIKWVVYRPDGAVELRPANPNYATITVEKEYAADASWFRIVGKVVSIVKKMKPRRAF